MKKRTVEGSAGLSFAGDLPPGFLRKNVVRLLLWPAAALLLASLLWVQTLSEIEKDGYVVGNSATRQIASLSRGYAEQLRHTVEQIDHITRSLKYDWEDPRIQLDLEARREKGLYPESSAFHVGVVNRYGAPVTAYAGSKDYFNRQEKPYFQFHTENPQQDLLISSPSVSLRTGSSVIHFTRRLDRDDGSFDGVAVVSVEPSYLLSFYDALMLGDEDFISVRRFDGQVLATKIGQNAQAAQIFYRQSPDFPAPNGVWVESGDKFTDGRARLIAWNRLDEYPLVAFAARTEESVYASHHETARKQLGMATAASAFLFLFSMAGVFLSARLAWRKQQAEEVKATYRLAVDAAREGFYMLRPLYDAHGEATDFLVEDCNERAADLGGYTKEQLLGTRLSQLYQGEYAQLNLETLRRALQCGFIEDEVRVPSQSRLKAGWVHRKLVRSGVGLAVTIRDISDAKEHEEALSAMANIDPLTGLPNRHWLTNFLPRAIEQARLADSSLAVLFVDLDDFKNINDTLGHAAGDELLKAAALRLKSLIRASDHVVRLGGDEFTLVLEQVHTLEDVSRVARLIVKALNEPFTLARSSGHLVEASIGISVFPQDGLDGDTLLKHADIAMYAAKTSGKGRYHFYQSQLSDRLVLRINREQALRQAIERDEFVLYYQPRVDTATGRLCSMEALVRWRHPERGIVLPVEFIQVAEDTGLILRLGQMVIQKACAQMAQWKAQRLPLVPVSINVSALQFNDGHVSNMLSSCMAKYEIDPSLIGVELTETCMAGENDTVSAELDDLRGLGVKLLVDDFGTGYSSLSQLQRLNVDVLKVDRAFTVTLCDGNEGKALFKAIVSMADALDICIVAEGVETAEQLDALQALSCDEVQGHYVSRPVPAPEMAALMLKRFLFPPAGAPHGALAV
jgi:diguanylate cyclase (GGDEF)-like protein/PAS domain S-box-containing protein